MIPNNSRGRVSHATRHQILLWDKLLEDGLSKFWHPRPQAHPAAKEVRVPTRNTSEVPLNLITPP